MAQGKHIPKGRSRRTKRNGMITKLKPNQAGKTLYLVLLCPPYRGRYGEM